MSFEQMLSQMPNLQQKFFICQMEGVTESTSQQEKDQWQLE